MRKYCVFGRFTVSVIANPRDRIGNPRGRIGNPRGRIGNPRDKMRNPRGRIANLRGRIRIPRGKVTVQRGRIGILRARIGGHRCRNADRRTFHAGKAVRFGAEAHGFPQSPPKESHGTKSRATPPFSQSGWWVPRPPPAGTTVGKWPVVVRLETGCIRAKPTPFAETIMKRRAMNAVAASLCEYLCSRNNDIAGYWGIGVLCAAARREGRAKYSFKVHPGKPLFINGCEITGSSRITDKLVKLRLDSIEGRLSFFPDGRYPDGAVKFTCGVGVAVTQGSRTGMSLSHVECWPHEAAREMQSARAATTRATLLDRLRRMLG